MNKFTLTAVVLMAGFWAAAAVADFAPLNLVVSSLLLTLSVAVVIAYGREAIDALAAREMPDTGDILAIGIAGSWATSAAGRLNGLAFRITGDIAWLQWDLLTFTFFVGCLSATAHLVAPHVHRTAPRHKSYIALWLALAGGAALAGFLIGLQWGG